MSLVCKMSQAAVLDQFIELFLKFQFLIGSLEAKTTQYGKEMDPGFNSS